VRSLEDVDNLGKGPRLERWPGLVSFAIPDYPIPRRQQPRFANPGCDDFGRDRITHRSKDLRNLVSR
jgi:hypothetical protein